MRFLYLVLIVVIKRSGFVMLMGEVNILTNNNNLRCSE